MNRRRLYRSADDRWIAGVAAGVADYFDADPVLVRIIWLILVPLTGGLALIAYLIMIVVVPIDSGEMPPQSPWQPGGMPVGYPGAYSPQAPVAGTPGAASPDATASGDPTQAGSAAPAGTAPAGTAPAGTAPVGGPAGYPAGAAPTGGPNQGWDWRWQSRQDRWQRRAERWQRRGERRGSGGLVFGVLLIVIGGLVAYHEIFPQVDLNLAWPIAIIAFGAFLVLSSVDYRRHE